MTIEITEEMTESVLDYEALVFSVQDMFGKGRRSPRRWNIGITAAPVRTKDQLENFGCELKHWKHWRVESNDTAQRILSLFVDHFLCGTCSHGGEPNATQPLYVYMY